MLKVELNVLKIMKSKPESQTRALTETRVLNEQWTTRFEGIASIRDNNESYRYMAISSSIKVAAMEKELELRKRKQKLIKKSANQDDPNDILQLKETKSQHALTIKKMEKENQHIFQNLTDDQLKQEVSQLAEIANLSPETKDKLMSSLESGNDELFSEAAKDALKELKQQDRVDRQEYLLVKKTLENTEMDSKDALEPYIAYGTIQRENSSAIFSAMAEIDRGKVLTVSESASSSSNQEQTSSSMSVSPKKVKGLSIDKTHSPAAQLSFRTKAIALDNDKSQHFDPNKRSNFDVIRTPEHKALMPSPSQSNSVSSYRISPSFPRYLPSISPMPAEGSASYSNSYNSLAPTSPIIVPEDKIRLLLDKMLIELFQSDGHLAPSLRSLLRFGLGTSETVTPEIADRHFFLFISTIFNFGDTDANSTMRSCLSGFGKDAEKRKQLLTVIINIYKKYAETFSIDKHSHIKIGLTFLEKMRDSGDKFTDFPYAATEAAIMVITAEIMSHFNHSVSIGGKKAYSHVWPNQKNKDSQIDYSNNTSRLMDEKTCRKDSELYNRVTSPRSSGMIVSTVDDLSQPSKSSLKYVREIQLYIEKKLLHLLKNPNKEWDEKFFQFARESFIKLLEKLSQIDISQSIEVVEIEVWRQLTRHDMRLLGYGSEAYDNILYAEFLCFYYLRALNDYPFPKFAIDLYLKHQSAKYHHFVLEVIERRILLGEEPKMAIFLLKHKHELKNNSPISKELLSELHDLIKEIYKSKEVSSYIRQFADDILGIL